MAGSPSPDKKKRFSWFRGSQAISILPVDDSAQSETDYSPRSSRSATRQSSELSSPLPPLLTRSPRPDSVISSVSTSDDLLVMRNRAPSSLGQVLEDAERIQLQTHPDGLPTYASTMTTSAPVSYGFTRCSPFAMIVSPDSGSGRGQGLYCISVGVNVWMPSSTVTTIRRGSSEEGSLVAELELGISSVPATVTVNGVCKNLTQIYFRKSSSSNSRLYFTGDGATIKWKLGANSWQAHVNSTLLATFMPTPPRRLILHPAGHRMADHIMVSLVIIMREHLTPIAGMRGDAAQLFNYSPHHSYQED